jgi:mRNA interferase RelE/StbE
VSISYKVYFADKRVEKIFCKILEKLPRDFQQVVYAKLKELGTHPYPQGKRIKPIKSELILYGYTADYRLRIGDYRVLYDVDEKNKKVVLLALRKRGKETYR